MDNGQLITIQTDTGELQGHDFISRLFCGTVNWFGHLMSDIAGSSGGRGNANGGRGSGIVIPFYELFGLCDFGNLQRLERLLRAQWGQLVLVLERQLRQ